MFKKSKLSSAVCCACMGIPLSGLAQSASDSKNPSKRPLEEIVVTATMRETTLQEVPYSISSYGGEKLASQGVTDFSKIARTIPGLSMSDVGRGKNSVSGGIFIRGININGSDSENFGSKTDPVVSVYMGETPLSANLELRDMSRVEVLRGPQSTLYGSGSLSGTLRYIPNKPEFEEFFGSMSTKIAQNAESEDLDYDGDLTLNIPITDNIAVRGVFAKIKNSGFIDSSYLEGLDENNQPTGVVRSEDDINPEDITMARVSARYASGDTTDILLTHAYQKDDIEGSAATSEGLGGYNSAAKLIEAFEREVNLTSLVIEHDLGLADLTSATSLTTNEASNTHDQSYSYGYSSFWSFYAGVPREVVRGEKTYESEAFTQELRLSGSTDAIDWLMGAYYKDSKYDETAYDTIYGVDAFYGIENPQAPDLAYSNHQKSEFTDRALFGELTYHITDRWQITGGLRRFNQDFYAFQEITLPPCGSFCGDGPTGYSSGEGEKNFSDTLFRLNSSFDFTDENAVYFNISQGFRHGGSNGVPIDDLATGTVEGGVYAEHPDYLFFDSDKTTNYELGFKGLLADSRVRYSAAVFYIQWEDPILSMRTPNGGFPIMFNGEEAQSQGLELEINATLNDYFVFNLGYSYTDATLTEDVYLPDVDDGVESQTLGGLKGDELPGVPKSNIVSSLEFATEVFNGIPMDAVLSVSYKSDFIAGYAAPSTLADSTYDEIPSSTILNASVSFDLDVWHVNFFADNLANADDIAISNGDGKYRAEKTGLQYDVEGIGDPAFRVRPRTVGVRIKYQF